MTPMPAAATAVIGAGAAPLLPGPSPGLSAHACSDACPAGMQLLTQGGLQCTSAGCSRSPAWSKLFFMSGRTWARHCWVQAPDVQQRWQMAQEERPCCMGSLQVWMQLYMFLLQAGTA